MFCATDDWVCLEFDGCKKLEASVKMVYRSLGNLFSWSVGGSK